MSMHIIETQGMKRPVGVEPGPQPEMSWLRIADLCIDTDYQRQVGKDGRKSIERIAANFEWSKFSTVIVSPVSGNRFAIIDGQHRTTAAALCGFASVPCQIISLDRAGQASAFAAINGNVTKITAWHIYKAALAANEGWARTCHRATSAANCTLMTYNKSSSAREPGELYGPTVIRDLIDRHGESVVTLALSAYRQSAYGDLVLAWNTVYVQSWIAAVGGCEKARGLPAAGLALFHETFDILEVDDVVATNLRQLKKEGQKPPAHWDALRLEIGKALKTFCDERN